jgi:hypothetical protein
MGRGLESLHSWTRHQARAECLGGGRAARSCGELDQDAVAEFVLPTVVVEERCQFGDTELFEFAVVFH